MAKQQIDTVRVTSCVTQLKNVNSSINTAFETMQRQSTTNLQRNWYSSAGDKAQKLLTELLKHSTEREKVLMNYIRFLEQQVNPSYENAESTNKSLADQFK